MRPSRSILVRSLPTANDGLTLILRKIQSGGCRFMRLRCSSAGRPISKEPQYWLDELIVGRHSHKRHLNVVVRNSFHPNEEWAYETGPGMDHPPGDHPNLTLYSD